MVGRPKRRSRDAKVRAELGLPARVPGKRAMNASEIAMLRMMHERRRDERVTRLRERGHRFRAWQLMLPKDIPWSVIGFIPGLGTCWLVFQLSASMGLTVIIGPAVMLCFCLLEARSARPMSEFDDDED